MTDGTPDNAWNRLVLGLGKLPGIGKRSAERIAFHLLKTSTDEALDLAAAITDLKKNVRHCKRCFNLTEGDLCAICRDAKRDHGTVLVVEQPNDIPTIEATGRYRGVYHVLMGRLSPLDGVGPGELSIDTLLRRVAEGKAGGQHAAIHEVILGTNPNLEGDGTALYLAERLAAAGVRVTRLARGLPTGSSLETVSKAVLADAVEGRQNVP
jgi:recombination protein RecR